MGVRNKTKLNLSSLFVYVVRLDDSSGTGEKNGIKKKNDKHFQCFLLIFLHHSAQFGGKVLHL